ncbi:reverse transcriptase domain, reverse transcriptase zinc-binding domain protein [Tanacetum coccineum]
MCTAIAEPWLKCSGMAKETNVEKEDEGYIMSYARDEDKDRSKLIIVDALSMKQTSVVKLPSRVPYGFHVITLVLRMLVEGNQPLQEKRQQAIESITLAINQAVERVKEALDKQRPPSPTCAAEGLNAIVSEAVEKGIFRGVKVGENKVVVSHLQFADDTIFFGEWNKDNAKSLMCILKCFEEVSGLRVNYYKSKLYGIGVKDRDLSDMARWMGCGVGEFPFTYLGLPIGERKKLSWVKWESLIASFGLGGLNIGSLRAKNLALLGKWWWRFKNEGGDLWVRVIKSIHGASGGLEEYRTDGVEGMGWGVWRDIVRVGRDIEGLGIEFYSSCVGVLGDGNDIGFWDDIWVDNRRLSDRFSRLYHLDRNKGSSIKENVVWVNGEWVWVWDWIRDIRGRVGNELGELVGVLQNVVISNNCRDRWRWRIFEEGIFTVKELSSLIEEKILHVEGDSQETLWNKLVPKKGAAMVDGMLKEKINEVFFDDVELMWRRKPDNHTLHPKGPHKHPDTAVSFQLRVQLCQCVCFSCVSVCSAY